MREFERIWVEEGQAYIRDTEIRAYEIVRQIHAGVRYQALLEQYPALEVEDIIESLGYGNKEIRELIAGYLGTEFARPIATISGFTDLLLLADPPLSEDKKVYVYQNLSESVAYMVTLRDYIFDRIALNYYPDRFARWETATIENIVKQAVARLPKGNPEIKAHVQIENLSVKIKNNGDLHKAVATLLYEYRGSYLKNSSTLRVTNTNNKIHVSIFREFANQANPIEADYYARSVNYPGTFEYVSYAIIRQHGGDIQIRESETGLFFEVDLPIWQENT